MRISHQTSSHMNIWLTLALLSGLLGGCAGMDSRGELPTVASVDLARYAGTWHEIARLPMWFQRHCVDSKAVYTVRSDGRVGVHNECVTDDGGLAEADGVATVVDTIRQLVCALVRIVPRGELLDSGSGSGVPHGVGRHAGSPISVDTGPCAADR